MCRNNECKADLRKVKSSTAGLRFHDLRHHAITELAESQASDQTIMAIAGHVSVRMLAHYSHVRLEAKRNALEALTIHECDRPSYGYPESSNSDHERDGYDTTDDTIAMRREVVPAELIDKNGRPGRTRTSDLFRVKVRLTHTSNNFHVPPETSKPL